MNENVSTITSFSSSDLDAAEARLCRLEFFEFVKSFWDVIIKEEPEYNWHIPYLCEELQKLSVPIVARQKKLYDIIINIPPGTTKTTIVTIMYPAWIWTQDPTLRIITNSYSKELSIEHATKSKDIITSDKYKRLFPEVALRRDKAGKASYENTSTGARYVTSSGSAITGKHAHLIINDDPQNPQQAESEAERKTANDHTKTLSSRKVHKEKTPVVTIMQRLHEDDVTGYLLKKKSESIKHICLPAELSDRVLPVELKDHYVDGKLDPSRLGDSALEEAKIDLGSRGYAGQFEQTPGSDEGNIIKKEWFTKIPRSEFDYLRDSQPIIFFGDTAFTDRKENDPSGFLGSCRIGNKIYITHATKIRKKFPDLIRFLPDYLKVNGYTDRSSLRIEPKANGLSVIDQLQESTDLNVTETPSPTDSKSTRLYAISPTIECGRVVLVEGDWNEEFIEEVAGFPVKVHDEYVDILTYAVDYHEGNVEEDQTDILNAFGR
ncbi:phage terminase large subunit family protein [Albibacterium profundi]|uniref:Terminase large subunit gp17-like C-terminal domain-containing protein n=1 Tax=Albibacterium profundi TaxID=3134906 RepID=A0ABV5CEX0_9SPHI